MDERLAAISVLPESFWSVIDRSALVGQTLFLTGATGFVGGWVLAAIARFNETCDVPIQVRALTRSPQSFLAPWLTWVPGDVCGFTDDVRADLMLHAALPSTQTPLGGEANLLETARQGILQVMRYAVRSGVRRTMVLSSGAVYGSVRTAVKEDTLFGQISPTDIYALAKREVEEIARAGERENHEVLIARLFTCIGEGYRSHSHLAHVAFLNDARAGRALLLQGDGMAVRSYFAGEDLGVWILALLSRRGSDTVNVGSDNALSIRDFAALVTRCAGRDPTTLQLGSAPAGTRAHFVPDITLARQRYGLEPWTPLETVVKRLLCAQVKS
jgi:UDP-glucuronate decarboxylase